jgi:hypothetical protein
MNYAYILCMWVYERGGKTKELKFESAGIGLKQRNWKTKTLTAQGLSLMGKKSA